MKPIRLAVLLSSGGTTLQNLLDRCADGRLPAVVSCVISNKPDAFGLVRARRAGVPHVAVVERQSYPNRDEFSASIFNHCRQAGVDLVCMGGFLAMLKIAPDFVNRVMNIHPSLIPAFCGKGFHGLHVHEAVLASGVKVSGCTVHFADDRYDQGPIIAQRCVPVGEEDTPEMLMGRIFAQECEVYPEAIRLFAEGRLRVEGQRVRILAAPPT